MNHKFYIGQEEQEEKVFHESDVELEYDEKTENHGK